MHVDKLDGRFPQEFLTGKKNDWRTEQAEILRKIEKHQNANFFYLEEGVRGLPKTGLPKEKATSRGKSGLSEIWLPGRDSNPRPIG
jgi:hypothetical protein